MEAQNALLDSIRAKGDKSYYYAHAPRDLGPEEAKVLEEEGIVTGGPPKLVGQRVSQVADGPVAVAIKNYSWMDEDEWVRVHIPFDHVPDQARLEIHFDLRSFELAYDRGEELHKLCVARLSKAIVPEESRLRVRRQKVILDLKKAEIEQWYSLADK